MNELGIVPARPQHFSSTMPILSCPAFLLRHSPQPPFYSIFAYKNGGGREQSKWAVQRKRSFV
ncbi:MAG: hypothetical protein MK108_06830, partial [Mariniblastus sp.]|nr:hypothetical protein [Mariniblastus sp.]